MEFIYSGGCEPAGSLMMIFFKSAPDTFWNTLSPNSGITASTWSNISAWIPSYSTIPYWMRSNKVRWEYLYQSVVDALPCRLIPYLPPGGFLGNVRDKHGRHPDLFVYVRSPKWNYRYDALHCIHIIPVLFRRCNP